MKKIFLFSLAATLFFAACKSKKTATASIPTATPADSFDANLTAAKTKFPDVTMDVLKQGHAIYYGACTRCHGAKDIAKRDEKEWIEVLDDMRSEERRVGKECRL